MALNKAESARINGAKSRGPTTEEGKQSSAKNACKHGLTSSLIVQQNEKDEEFQLLLAALIEKFQPADAVEYELVFEAAAARFQLRRVWALETAAIDLEMDQRREWVDEYRPGYDEATRIALAWKSLGDSSKVIATLNRYHSRIRRDFEKAIRDLEHIRAGKTLTQPKLPNEPKTVTSAAPASPGLERKPVTFIRPIGELPNEPKPLSPYPIPSFAETPPITMET